MAVRAAAAEVIVSSRQTGVRIRCWRRMWPRRSSSGSGCSTYSSPKSSSFTSASAVSSVYAALASTESGVSGKASRTARTTSASRPGSIFSFTRR
jgi:hypothetical protein